MVWLVEVNTYRIGINLEKQRTTGNTAVQLNIFTTEEIVSVPQVACQTEVVQSVPKCEESCQFPVFCLFSLGLQSRAN